MFELTIKNKVYPFNFGMGFLREINKKVDIPVDGVPGMRENVGLRYTVGMLLANDLEALVDVLDVANKGLQPRVSRGDLDHYIESEDTDIDALFRDVLDFLERANATKRAVKELREAFEARKKQSEQK